MTFSRPLLMPILMLGLSLTACRFSPDDKPDSKKKTKTEKKDETTTTENTEDDLFAAKEIDLSYFDKVQEELTKLHDEADIVWTVNIIGSVYESYAGISYATLREKLDKIEINYISFFKIKVESKSEKRTLAASNNNSDAIKDDLDLQQLNARSCSDKIFEKNDPKDRYKICNFEALKVDAVRERVEVICTYTSLRFFGGADVGYADEIACKYQSGNVPEDVKDKEPRIHSDAINLALSKNGGLEIQSNNPLDDILLSKRMSATIVLPRPSGETSTTTLQPDTNSTSSLSWYNRDESASTAVKDAVQVFRSSSGLGNKKFDVTFKLEWLRTAGYPVVSVK